MNTDSNNRSLSRKQSKNAAATWNQLANKQSQDGVTSARCIPLE